MKTKLYLSIFFSWFLSSLTNAQELNLYDLNYVERGSDTLVYTSLSDSYVLSEDPDSSAIPDLEGKSIDEVRYFTLENEYRTRFLEGTGISESDQLFIYDYENDKLMSFHVKNLKVIACLSIYASDEEFPFSDDDYQIGFDLDKTKLQNFSNRYYSSALVYVGKENPFETGKMKAIKWEECDTEKLNPIESQALHNRLIPEGYKNFEEGTVYSTKSGEFRIFVRKIRIPKEDINVEHLLVINRKTNEIVCDKLFFEGEGSGHAPLNGMDSNYTSADIFQWAGKLFKDKPPVVFGFAFYGFGCPEISFLKKDEPDVYIQCDNRH